MKIAQTLAIACTLLVTLVAASAAIIGVSIPVGSQNPLCRPSYDNIWSITNLPFPPASQAGIGIIVSPTSFSYDDNQDFALHQNDAIQPSPLYIASNVPDPATVTVTYTFDRPETISGVEIIQHANGITKVEGFLGNSTNSLVSLGSVFGPSGDITSGTNGTFVAPDGTSQVFNFGNTNLSGTVFQLVIRKTSYPTAFATHRIYPLGTDATRICTASGPLMVTIHVSEVQICWNSDCDKSYQVQFSAESTTNAWVNLGDPVQGNGSTNCVADPTGSHTDRKYRVVVLMP